jgi:hypothetical protein
LRNDQSIRQRGIGHESTRECENVSPAHTFDANANGPNEVRHQIMIVGGGTAGITVAARLTKGWFNRTGVAVIDPATKHYYQPLWTLAGRPGGKDTLMPEDAIPDSTAAHCK